jgi:glycosyltransferase involved in cell wall biosynthesis
LRIAIITPTAPPRVSGSAVTASRIARGLQSAGDQVELIDASSVEDGAEIMTQLAMFTPDIVHVVDAWKVGSMLGDPLPGHPLVLQTTGSDVHADIYDSARQATVQRVLAAARAIVVASDEAATALREVQPEIGDKVRVVTPGVVLAEDTYQLRRELGIKMSGFVFLLPGVICALKNQGLAIEALDRIIDDHPNVHLVLAGPVDADDEYGARILEAAEARAWCHHVDGIEHAQMGAAYADVDVVLNTSLVEGGSNALLEAMSAGRVVLASDIPGNRGLVRDGETGLFFSGSQELTEAARKLIGDASLRQRLGGRGHEHAGSAHRPEAEVEALRAVYEEWQGR